MARELKPWHRRPGEGGQAHDALMVYLDMGTERTVRLVGKVVGKSHTQIGKWSSKHDWVERSEEYDSHMADMVVSEHSRQVREANRKHIVFSNALLQKGLAKLKDLDYSLLTATDVLAYVQAGIKIQREAMGIPNVMAHEVSTPESKSKIFIVLDPPKDGDSSDTDIQGELSE